MGHLVYHDCVITYKWIFTPLLLQDIVLYIILAMAIIAIIYFSSTYELSHYLLNMLKSK